MLAKVAVVVVVMKEGSSMNYFMSFIHHIKSLQFSVIFLSLPIVICNLTWKPDDPNAHTKYSPCLS